MSYKSILIILAFTAFTNLSFAQTNQVKNLHKSEDSNFESLLSKNELKLNLAYLPFGYLELSYERILPKNTSVGIAIGKSIKDLDLEYHLAAFYRLFFGHQPGSGFFIEANAGSWKEDTRFSDEGLSGGIGVAVGGKFFRGDKFHGEFVFGYGKTLLDKSSDFSEAYPRFGISLGHRF